MHMIPVTVKHLDGTKSSYLLLSSNILRKGVITYERGNVHQTDVLRKVRRPLQPIQGCSGV